MAKTSIEYGVRSPGGLGFDRRPVKSFEDASYDFGKRGDRGKLPDDSASITYFGGKGSRGDANYVKQKKMQGVTGGQGRGKDSFGSPKGSTSSFKGNSGSAKQKKGFGGQTTTQY